LVFTTPETTLIVLGDEKLFDATILPVVPCGRSSPVLARVLLLLEVLLSDKRFTFQVFAQDGMRGMDRWTRSVGLAGVGTDGQLFVADFRLAMDEVVAPAGDGGGSSRKLLFKFHVVSWTASALLSVRVCPLGGV
jgi:hypothetical protein